MSERLAEHIISCSPDEIAALYLEDVALCAAWYESYEEDEAMTDRYAALRQAFDHWVREAAPPAADTEGYRQQPLMRELIAELTEGHAARLERDELDVLYFAVALARRSGKLDIFRRVLSCTAPHMKSVERVRKMKALIPGCPNVGKRIAIVTETDLRAAEARDVRTFGGLNLPLRGPVYMREGNVKVLGSIPAECTVVVDQGSCCVRGNVEGNLAVTDACDALGNVSGVVVARRGSINARDVLNKATLVSKEDSIHVRAVEFPKQLFAAREIHIKGDATGGRYLARRLFFHGDLTGGDIYVTEQAEAENFIQTDELALRVCLLRGLSCQDYGEVLSAEASLLLNSAMKLRQRLDHLEELSEISEREADDYAGNVLMYVLGEDDTKNRVQEIQKQRRRLSFMERLVSGIHALVSLAEDRINLCEEGGGAEDQATLDDLRRELASLANEGSIETALHEAKEDVLYLGRKLQRRGMSMQGLQQVMSRLLDKESELQEQAQELSARVLKDESAIERAMGREALLERARAECSRVEMLKQLSSAARKRPDVDVFKQRLNDRYVRLLQRTMENRHARGRGYRSTCLEIHDRITSVREKLWTEYRVSLPDHVLQGWAVGGAKISGRFAPGILICPWRHLIDDPSSSPHSCVYTKSEEGFAPERRTYVRSDQSTVEELDPPESDGAAISISI